MRDRITRYIGLLGALALFASCSEKPYYEEYMTIGADGWHQDSLVTFSVEIEDTSKFFGVLVNIRNNNDYPYSNLYLFRQIESENGVEYSDTASYTLADAYGKWLGEGVGELKTGTFPYRTHALRFFHPGVYTFTFQQAMRNKRLKGIEDVGISIFKLEQQQNHGKEETEKES